MPLEKTAANKFDKATTPSAEEGYREALADVVTVARQMAPYCMTVNELIGMAELALSNDAQLKLLMSLGEGK